MAATALPPALLELLDPVARSRHAGRSRRTRRARPQLTALGSTSQRIQPACTLSTIAATRGAMPTGSNCNAV